MSAQHAGTLERSDVFAALGEPHRLSILDAIGREPASASALCGELDITRQAVTKHLRVLERAGLVETSRVGREVRFAVRVDAVAQTARWLDDVATGWERRLAEIKRTAETRGPDGPGAS